MWLPPTHTNRVDHDPWSANNPTGMGEIGGMLLGVWDDIVYSKADIHNVDTQPLGWVLSGVGVVLCENCIVDASIFILLCNFA